jgi:hypothetical protein
MDACTGSEVAHGTRTIPNHEFGVRRLFHLRKQCRRHRARPPRPGTPDARLTCRRCLRSDWRFKSGFYVKEKHYLRCSYVNGKLNLTLFEPSEAPKWLSATSCHRWVRQASHLKIRALKEYCINANFEVLRRDIELRSFV